MRKTVYIIHAIHWKYDDEWYYRDGEGPIRAFAHRESAERFCKEQEAEARADLLSQELSDEFGDWTGNLYTTFGSLEAITSLTRTELDKHLYRMGIPGFPVGNDSDGGFQNPWWKDLWSIGTSVAEQEEKWALFDKVRFYEVIAMEVEPT